MLSLRKPSGATFSYRLPLLLGYGRASADGVGAEEMTYALPADRDSLSHECERGSPGLEGGAAPGDADALWQEWRASRIAEALSVTHGPASQRVAEGSVRVQRPGGMCAVLTRDLRRCGLSFRWVLACSGSTSR